MLNLNGKRQVVLMPTLRLSVRTARDLCNYIELAVEGDEEAYKHKRGGGKS